MHRPKILFKELNKTWNELMDTYSNVTRTINSDFNRIYYNNKYPEDERISLKNLYDYYMTKLFNLKLTGSRTFSKMKILEIIICMSHIKEHWENHISILEKYYNN